MYTATKTKALATIRHRYADEKKSVPESPTDDIFVLGGDSDVERYKALFAWIEKGALDESNLLPLFSDLSDDVVNSDAYDEAVNAGIDAVPGETNADAAQLVEIWLSKTRKYSSGFPARIAQEVSAAAYDAEREAKAQDLAGDDLVDFVMNAIDDKVEALRPNALLYSEPPWGAGNNAYGATLEANGVLIDWVVEPGACDICAPMPDGNPYTLAALPMWPGDPHPNCRCHITPDDETWQSIFGDAAG